MGLTFKENVKDYRNSKALDIINELRKNNAKVIGWDPLLDSETVKKEFGVMNLPFEKIETMNALIILAPHRQFSELKPEEIARKIPQGVLFDLTGLFDSNKVKESGLIYLTL